MPPVLPQIRADLHLTFSQAGALTAMPVLGLGAAAVPGALLVARFGPRRVAGLAVLGLGAAGMLRGAGPWALFFFTALLALCVAVAQPACAVVLRTWFRDAVQPATSAYAAALGMGALAGGFLTLHLLALGGWRGTFLIWGGLAALGGAAWLLLAPGQKDAHVPVPAGLGRMLRRREVWHTAAVFGAQSLAYYAASTWIPFLLRPAGPGAISLTLAALNVSNIPVAIALASWRWPWSSSRRFYAVSGAVFAVGAAGLLALPAFYLGWSLLMGTAIACTFTGASAAPVIYARRDSEVAAFSALELTAGYALSFIGPLLGGLLLDLTGDVRAPFVPVLASALALVVLGATLPKPSPAEPVEPRRARVSESAAPRAGSSR